MAVLSNIPPALQEALNNPPEPGNRNVWLFTVAKRARHFASEKKVRALLLQVAAQWTDRDFTPEIDRAVTRAFSGGTSSVSSASDRPPWPDYNPAAWTRRLTTPIPFPEEPLDIPTEQVIDRLFPGNPLICAAQDTRSAITQEREAWRGKEAALQFIVANPMTAETGLNQDGKVSSRCLDNATKRRRYLVVEFDRGEITQQAAILSSLSTEQVPLILVLWSGGKSLHGWFNVEKLTQYQKNRFFRHAVFLGADPTLWDPSKLVRMPGGRRDNGNTQHIFHFNPPGTQLSRVAQSKSASPPPSASSANSAVNPASE